MTDQDPYSAGVTTDAADAPAPDAPAPDDASGPDVGKSWGLSDEAASALYPDVDDAEPPQIEPDAEQVPPPFAQRPSPLLDIVRMYGSGHTDWAQAKQALIDFDYAPLPAPTGSPTGPTAGQWYADVENNAQGPEVPGSWPELVAAADHGMITQQELGEVLAARASKGQDDGGQPAAPGPTEGKAWSAAARKAAHESRLRHLADLGFHPEDVPQLPRPGRGRTTPLPNGTRVRHEDGRIGRVEHITVADLRAGDTLINPVTGAHTGRVTGVRWGRNFEHEADDRTPLGHNRQVHVDGQMRGVSAMGARYTRFVPDAKQDLPPADQWFPDRREHDTHHMVTADGGHAEVSRDEDHEDTWYIDVTHPNGETDAHTALSEWHAKDHAEKLLKRGHATT